MIVHQLLKSSPPFEYLLTAVASQCTVQASFIRELSAAVTRAVSTTG